ncbi:MAG: ABC transporter ATP-binding protein [Clostridia bacterium]|nr:ABC transporter ATP-binding protein [Clostridia bacterium]
MFKLLKNLKWIDYLFLVIVVGLVGLQVFLDLRLPEYMANISSELTQGAKNVNYILKNGGFMLLCALGSLASAITVGFFSANIASRLSFNIRGKVYDKIQSFSLSEIKKFSTASLITRTTNDVTQVQMVVSMGMQALIKAPILAVCAIIKIVGKGWQWSLATGVTIAVLTLIVLLVVVFAIPKFKKIQTLTDNINRVTRENLTGIRVIRASNAEDYQDKKFEKCNVELSKTHLFASRIMAIMGAGMSLLMSSLSLAIYWIGAYIVKDGAGFDNMIVFTSYAMQVVMAFMLLIMIFILLPRALVSAKRINAVLDTKNSIVPGCYADENFDGKASVVFENVSFKYPDADEYILKDINFEAFAGETVAFIGSTGSGKSTLINLIPRLYDVTDGRVLVDGVDVKNYAPEVLNRKIGYVPQRGVLFAGTVKSNVNFGDNNADDEMIKSAISTAQASNFVSRMSDGVDSAIAQGGTNVSGGQKQRLSIARAIARRPEIFIFDDSFSALDYKTDRKLRSALKKHTANVTKFIVAQRIGTIKDADKIIVLDNGEMVGIGKHEDLLKNCPVYQEIALSQLSKEEL